MLKVFQHKKIYRNSHSSAGEQLWAMGGSVKTVIVGGGNFIPSPFPFLNTGLLVSSLKKKLKRAICPIIIIM